MRDVSYTLMIPIGYLFKLLVMCLWRYPKRKSTRSIVPFTHAPNGNLEFSPYGKGSYCKFEFIWDIRMLTSRTKALARYLFAACDFVHFMPAMY